MIGLVIGLKHHPPALSSQKKWNAHFWITFNFWWLAGLLHGLEPHLPPLSSQKMQCSFLDYFQFWVISQAGQWTQTPSTTPLQPKNEMLIFGLHSTSDDQLGWSMDSNPICHPSPNKKWYAHFCITFNFWWLARLVNGLEPHLQPLSNQKYEMLVYGLRSTSDDQPGWSKDLNPICNLFPTNKMKCSFWYYVQLLLISWAGGWTQTPSVTPLQPKKWNACFCIMFNFWWSARLVDGLKPHLPPLSSQKNEMLIFVLHSTSDDWPGWSLDSNTIHLPSQAKKKWNAHFWITFNFWWSARLVDGLEPHLQTLSNQQNEMLILVLCSTSDDQPGWSMDSNPICNPSAAKKMKCLFLHYVQLLMIGRAGRWTRTPSATSLQA